MAPEHVAAPPPKVFVWYARDSDSHCEQVLALAQRLRVDGIDARLDVFEPAPAQGWPRWFADSIRDADFVVVVCSPALHRTFEFSHDRDAAYVGLLLTQQLREGSIDHRRLVPVSFDVVGKDHIPLELRSGTHHELPHGYERLYRQLTASPAIVPVPLAGAAARFHGENVLKARRWSAVVSYLAQIERFHARRSPLRGMLRDDGGPLAELTMDRVELDVLVVPDQAAWSTSEDIRPVSLFDVLDARLEAGERPTLCVLGEVGTGKSTLLEQTLYRLAERARTQTGAALPVLISAEDLPQDPVRRQARYCELSRGAFTDELRGCRRIYLIDGYDELDANTRAPVDAALDDLRADALTGAVVICSRSAGAPRALPRDRFRVAAWTDVEVDRFLARWHENSMGARPPGPAATNDLHVLGNPLTATLYLACATPDAGGSVGRAGLFTMVVTKLFDGWAGFRPPNKAGEWADVAAVFERLAYELLSTGCTSFEAERLWQALDRIQPRAELRREAHSREMGLLHRRADGQYEFPLRPIAEHLAGAYLMSWDPPQVAALAASAWAREPVRHYLGLLDRKRRRDELLECFARLCDAPNSEIDTVDSLSRVSVAVNAAVDIGPAADAVVEMIADRLISHLFDGSSSWRPTRAQALVRMLVERGSSALASVVRTRIEAQLEHGADGDVLTYVHERFRDLYHRSSVVRLAAVRRFAEAPDDPKARRVLLTMLFDLGTDSLVYSVPVAAALGLRAARRDEPFMRHVLPQLQQLLSWVDQRSGVAACALHPDEAEPRLLAQAIRDLSTGHSIPTEVLEDLALTDAGRAALDEFAIPVDLSRQDQFEAQMLLQADGERTSVSLYVRHIAVRALGPHGMDAKRLAELVARARRGALADLEVLCEYAVHDSAPLIELLESVAGTEPTPPRSMADLVMLRFTPACVPHLRRATARNRRLLVALVELWDSAQAPMAPFRDYPAAALESYVASDERVARVYSEWINMACKGTHLSPSVPEALRRIPAVSAAAESVIADIIGHAFEGRVGDDGKLGYLQPGAAAKIFAATRGFWLRNGVTCARLTGWLRSEDPTKIAAAMHAFGPHDFPRSECEIVLEWARGEHYLDKPHKAEATLLQITAIMFCVEAGLVDQARDRLHSLSRGRSPARFAAAAALALANDDAASLSENLASQWPDPNWNFWYGRTEGVLPTLVRAAPNAWAGRAAQLGTDGLEVARALLEHLPRALQLPLLRKVVAAAEPWSLPWVVSMSAFGAQRLLDTALEMAFDAGFDSASLRIDDR